MISGANAETPLPIYEPTLINQTDTTIPQHAGDVLSYSTAIYRSPNAQIESITPNPIPIAQSEQVPVSTLKDRWRFSMARRKLGAFVALATTVLTTGAVFDATPAAADSDVYMVVDTGNGVYARNSPHLAQSTRLKPPG